MQISVSSTLTVYHDGQFWVGLAEHVEGGRYGVACIVFGAEPSNEEILHFITGKWAKLSFFGDEVTETSRPAKNPKRRAREAAKALKRPAVSTKAQQALANQYETMKRESAQARSQRRTDEAEARFEQRKLKRKRKQRGH
ncbi:YjdF family protein [Collinsella aerofaciens]|uniref:YjdF family protein n=1 Tax=Collinsella aerofaciens TaxID=74426 RepID=UPI002906080E|nr:YjdF family protein [Collinsella aerofaciens]MDU8576290.1 YjdF family protein [Collinsella aerofaciens]